MAFDDFWELYPRKASKGQARRTWEKLVKARIITPTVQQFILDNLTIRIQDDDAWVNGQRCFISHPSTWLNNEGWSDEYTTIADTKPAPKKLGQMTDSELLVIAREKRIRTAGKDRFQLMEAISSK